MSTSTKTKFENRLAKEKSPYLLQHKNNPVDWYPWGNEAFEKAKKENKPIFLSVGYSTCHWCHVMEKESFESEEIADILNKHFVPIKVDREERPDVDRIYMLFVQATSGGGGWPMSVWLTPDLKPFYAGTYFPPSGKYGRPGFSDILYRIDGIWKKQKEDVLENADDIMSQLENHVQKKSGATSSSIETDFVTKVFGNYYTIIEGSYDSKLGGFSSAPKFPRPVVFTALFQHYLRTKNPNTLSMCEFTLKQMFKGGMHDHLGGGFHRYSVDKYWHVPHFEKMLYDQAQLVTSYLTAYQLSKKEIFAEAARDILDYVSTKLLSKEGGFYSAEDADSKVSHDSEEKAEGAFFVWTKDEIDSILQDDSPLFCYHYGVEKAGNTPPNSDPHGEFRNKNVLIQRYDVEDTAKNFKLSVEEAKEKLKLCKQKLYEIREKRPHPFLDDKIITSWNGLMIAAFAEASQVLSDKKYLDIATNAAQFIESVLYKDEHLIRNFREHASNIKGFADDYAFMITALLNLYEAGGNVKWLEWALTLQEKMNELFYDDKGGYFATQEMKGELLLRIKEDYDGAEPSANSYAVMNLLRLHYIAQSQSYLDKAKKTIQYFRSVLEGRPIVCPHMVAALDWLDNEPRQIVIASNDLEDETTRKFKQIIFSKFMNRIILYADEGKGQKYLLSLGVDYIKDGSMRTNNSVTAHVCHNMKCEIFNDLSIFNL